MKRRSLLLMILIVLLPIALLTWFALRMARDEQALVQQRYRALMEQRLQDVNRTIAQRFQETERRLQQITSLDDFALDELRAVVRREPQVTQLFVLTPNGELMYPNPASQLNGTEQSFLRQAFRMFSDRDLQNAVALAEAGAVELQQMKFNRIAQRRSRGGKTLVQSGVSRRPDSNANMELDAVGANGDLPTSPREAPSGVFGGFGDGGLGGLGTNGESQSIPSISMSVGGNEPLIADNSRTESPAPASAELLAEMSPPMPRAADGSSVNDIQQPRLTPEAETPDAAREMPTVESSALPDQKPSEGLVGVLLSPFNKGLLPPSDSPAAATPLTSGEAERTIPVPERNQTATNEPLTNEPLTNEPMANEPMASEPLTSEPILPKAASARPQRAAAGQPSPPGSVVESGETATFQPPMPVSPADPTERKTDLDARDSPGMVSNASETGDVIPYPESRGWFVWYWDRGMNLVYWQRRPSGHIVGAALERARWIADLISWLPESNEQERDSSGFDTSFRVITSSAEPVYNWGANSTLTEPPFCEVPLAGPLASWRLQCFVPMVQITAGGGRSAFLGFGSGLVAFALTLCGLTWILYRDYARDMREASQQVSFVNQVSHELKTPLTNIRMYAELLERDLDKVDEEHSAKPRRRLEIINAEAQRLSRLIGNVLTFARQKKKTLQISPTSLDPVALVRQIAERFGPSLEEKGIALHLEGHSARQMNLDADFIEQILGNLISNVEKYAASGRQLTIRTTCSDQDVTIDVIDAGPGIPEKFRGSVFEPFERLNNDLRASSGTGIGLSIARDLARIHRGDLTLLPTEIGCWFQIRLAVM